MSAHRRTAWLEQHCAPAPAHVVPDPPREKGQEVCPCFARKRGTTGSTENNIGGCSSQNGTFNCQFFR